MGNGQSRKPPHAHITTPPSTPSTPISHKALVRVGLKYLDCAVCLCSAYHCPTNQLHCFLTRPVTCSPNSKPELYDILTLVPRSGLAPHYRPASTLPSSPVMLLLLGNASACVLLHEPNCNMIN